MILGLSYLSVVSMSMNHGRLKVRWSIYIYETSLQGTLNCARSLLIHAEEWKIWLPKSGHLRITVCHLSTGFVI